MDPSDELEKLRKKVAELEEEMGKLKLRRQREDDEEKEVSYRKKTRPECRPGCPLLELTIVAASAVLVLSGVAEEMAPRVVTHGVDKYVVTCDELCRVLTQKAVRRVLLFIPFHTPASRQSTWQSVVDHIPFRAEVSLCPAVPSPRRDITKGQVDEFARLLDGLDRLEGETRPFSLKPELIRSLKTLRHGDAEHFGRFFWSKIGRCLESQEHWPRMFEVLDEQEEAELEAEAARRLQEQLDVAEKEKSQPVETKAEKTENAAEEAEIQKKQKKEKSGTVFGCVKSTLKNMFRARK